VALAAIHTNKDIKSVKVDSESISHPFKPPTQAFSMTTTTSQGSGGQHVNKTHSRVNLSLDLNYLPEKLRQALIQQRNLPGRLSQDGQVWTVSCQESRSQHRNKEGAYKVVKEVLDECTAGLQPPSEEVLKKRGEKQERIQEMRDGWNEQRMAEKKMASRKKMERRKSWD
jgi:ribosome-associated protein